MPLKCPHNTWKLDIHVCVCLLDLPRPRKRLTELMMKAVKEGRDEVEKCWGFRFFRSPVEILTGADGKKATGIRLALNKLEVNVQDRITTVISEYVPIH